MRINAKTNVVAIIGHPVGHSLSPAMHNAAFEAMGVDFCYVAFDVHPQDVREAVHAVRALGLAGLNVTVPHKEAVMSFLDKISPEASFIGAVNTIVNANGKLVGHNTDGRGFMRSLEEEGVEVKDKVVHLIGVGGAARAVSYYLAQECRELRLWGRTPERVQRLADDLLINHKNIVVADSAEPGEDADVVINATPLGLKDTDNMPCDAGFLTLKQVAVDLIYRETPWLRAAEAGGLRAVHGLGMLLWQGVLANELWTGQEPPVDVMRSALVGSTGFSLLR
jgi:shikimate dehydrogenase